MNGSVYIPELRGTHAGRGPDYIVEDLGDIARVVAPKWPKPINLILGGGLSLALLIGGAWFIASASKMPPLARFLGVPLALLAGAGGIAYASVFVQVRAHARGPRIIIDRRAGTLTTREGAVVPLAAIEELQLVKYSMSSSDGSRTWSRLFRLAAAVKSDSGERSFVLLIPHAEYPRRMADELARALNRPVTEYSIGNLRADGSGVLRLTSISST